MASCSKCNTEVGCACNLINSYCARCYNATLDSGQAQKTTNLVYVNKPDSPAVNGFTEILKMPNLTKEEKLKRINDILEKARQ